MVKHLIKEISEEDFRKLNIQVYRHERVSGDNCVYFKMVQHSLNDILDKNIQACLDYGYESDLKDLQMPVYVAIHEENNDEYSGYLDKYMNRYTGLQTFQIGFGIPHLYSTRDYYQMRGDWWRVAKKETAIIYKIILDKKWQSRFVLKHKTQIEDRLNDNDWYESSYDLNELTGEWEYSHTVHIKKRGAMTIIEPVKENKDETIH